MNTSFWLWAALGGIFISLIIAVVTAYLSKRTEEKISKDISAYIASGEITVEKLELGKGQLDELRKIIHNKSLPIEITEYPRQKRKYIVTLKSSIGIKTSVGIKKDEIETELRSSLFYADFTGIAAIFAIMLAVLSFFGLLRPSSSWDIIAIVIAPIILIIELLAIFFIIRLRIKKRSDKSSKK